MSDSSYEFGRILNYNEAINVVELPPGASSDSWHERGPAFTQVVKPDGLYSERYPQIFNLVPWLQDGRQNDANLGQMFEGILNESSDRALLFLVGPRRSYKSWLLVAMFIQDVWMYILTTDRASPPSAERRDKVKCIFITTHGQASLNLRQKVYLCLDQLPQEFTMRVDVEFVTENEYRLNQKSVGNSNNNTNAVMVYLDEHAFLSPMFMRNILQDYESKSILALRGSTTRVPMP